jgi:hypothetical protein
MNCKSCNINWHRLTPALSSNPEDEEPMVCPKCGDDRSLIPAQPGDAYMWKNGQAMRVARIMGKRILISGNRRKLPNPAIPILSESDRFRIWEREMYYLVIQSKYGYVGASADLPLLVSAYKDGGYSLFLSKAKELFKKNIHGK